MRGMSVLRASVCAKSGKNTHSYVLTGCNHRCLSTMLRIVHIDARIGQHGVVFWPCLI
jgi:hypothetical protein